MFIFSVDEIVCIHYHNILLFYLSAYVYLQTLQNALLLTVATVIVRLYSEYYYYRSYSGGGGETVIDSDERIIIIIISHNNIIYARRIHSTMCNYSTIISACAAHTHYDTYNPLTVKPFVCGDRAHIEMYIITRARIYKCVCSFFFFPNSPKSS